MSIILKRISLGLRLGVPVVGLALLAGCKSRVPAAPVPGLRAERTAGRAGVSVEGRTTNLRGYGRVTATLRPRRAVFVCQDATHANILQGKLLADLFWGAGHRPSIPVVIPACDRRNLRLGARSISMYVRGRYGAIVVGRVGNRVIAVGGNTVAALRNRLLHQQWWRSKGARFQPGQPYPVYLDFYDLRAFKAYVHAMSSVHGLGLASHWPFIKKFGLGGTSFQDLGFNFQCPAPGVVEFTPGDYEVRTAQRQGGMTVPCISVGDAPAWVGDLFPNSMMQPSPTALIGAWGAAGCAGTRYPSWGISAAKRNLTQWAFLRQAMDRYRKSAAVGGWLLYSGAPGGEFGMHERTDIFWDYSPAGEALFRHWLRDVRHETLQDLGRRWYGVADHFHSWRQVTPPDLNSFFGRLNDACLRLTRHWRWLAAGSGSPLTPPQAKAPGWIPTALAPSEREMFLPWGAAFYRTHFDARAWLARHTGQSFYLVCALNSCTSHGCQVWLNGRYLGKCRSKVPGWGPFALKVNGLLKPGMNRLVLKVPGPEGKIFGPVFLTTTRPTYYPYLGRHHNARYVDLVEWQRWANIQSLRSMLKRARAIDPNRPMVISGSAGSVTAYVAGLASRFGCGVEFTGDGGFYHPWWDGLGMLDGFYGTGEEGGTEHGRMLDRELGWNLMQGDSSHSLFWDLEDYMLQQRSTGWFSRHQRLIQLFGKAVLVKPRIVILRSALALELGSSAPWNWDIGRGELQEAHYDNAYATERELLNGTVERYGAPVLFDDGTQYMGAKVLAALRRYVESGGTFIVLQNTGRDGLTRPNTWPISRLTGFKVVATGKSGLIRFGQHLPLLGRWAGRQFTGQGIAIDYLHVDHAKGAGIGLKRGGHGTVALARWEHGGHIAVGYRQLGKGRIVVLGSTFWRYGQDLNGSWQGRRVEQRFFHRLFTNLGIHRNADAGKSQVWARKFITKNGLQDWLIAFNNGDAVTTRVGLRVTHRPRHVWDMLTRRPVPFTYTANGWVWVHGVKFRGDGVRVFGVRRTGFLGALPFWWANKCFYWKKRFAISPAWRQAQERRWRRVRAWPRRQAMGFDHWRFYADKTGKFGAGAAWRQPSFDDQAWRSLRGDPWNLLVKSLASYHGVGLYRAAFALPPSWQGRRIVLGLYSFNTPIVYDRGTFYLNGSKVAAYRARGWSQTLIYDVTSHLRFGKENVLAVKVRGGKQFSGLGGAIWLAPEVRLKPAVSLAGDWQVVQGNYLTQRPVVLPGRAVGRYLRREVKIPRSWRGRSIYLHVATPSQWLGSVMVNGHPINYNAYLHPFGLLADINLTPYARPGRVNRLELWPYRAIPNRGNAGSGTVSMRVRAISIGCAVSPGVAGRK